MDDNDARELTPFHEQSPLVGKMAELHAWTMAHIGNVGIVQDHPNIVRREAHFTSTQPDYPDITLSHNTYPLQKHEVTVVEWAKPTLRGLGSEISAIRYWELPNDPAIVEYCVNSAAGDQARAQWFKIDDPKVPQLDAQKTQFIGELLDQSLQTLKAHIPG